MQSVQYVTLSIHRALIWTPQKDLNAEKMSETSGEDCENT